MSTLPLNFPLEPFTQKVRKPGEIALTDTRFAGEAFFTSPLYTLLQINFPQFQARGNSINVPKFATAIGYSHEGVYKWLRSGKMSRRGAELVVALSQKGENPLTMDDLKGFLTFR